MFVEMVISSTEVSCCWYRIFSGNVLSVVVNSYVHREFRFTYVLKFIFTAFHDVNDEGALTINLVQYVRSFSVTAAREGARVSYLRTTKDAAWLYIYMYIQETMVSWYIYIYVYVWSRAQNVCKRFSYPFPYPYPLNLPRCLINKFKRANDPSYHYFPIIFMFVVEECYSRMPLSFWVVLGIFH